MENLSLLCGSIFSLFESPTSILVKIQKINKNKLSMKIQTLVGTAGFEPATSCAPCKCATRLRYAPRNLAKYSSTNQQTATKFVRYLSKKE